MERVTFLIEATSERIVCLLNPENVILRRSAGITTRRSSGRPLAGSPYREDPLLYTGGGRTEIDLELLFDVSLSGAADEAFQASQPEQQQVQIMDVRDLTGQIWRLSENSVAQRGNQCVPTVRFVWGKSWNILTVVEAVAERFEYFTPQGLPRRSWLKVRLLRVDEPTERTEENPTPLEDPMVPSEFPEVPEEDVTIHEVIGGSSRDGGGHVSRPDLIAADTLGDAEKWPHLLAFNRVDDPAELSDGFQLRIPPRWVLGSR